MFNVLEKTGAKYLIKTIIKNMGKQVWENEIICSTAFKLLLLICKIGGI